LFFWMHGIYSLVDSMKMYVHAHGSKTSNLVINLEPTDVFFRDEETLEELGVENETEISFFNLKAYLDYKANPETKW
jgi:hypothetical protein